MSSPPRADEVGFDPSHLEAIDRGQFGDVDVPRYRIPLPDDVPTAGDGGVIAILVSMGNPHAVIFLDHEDRGAGSENPLDPFDLAALGPAIEHHRAFPNRTNVHLVEVLGPREMRMRTWERGSGLTLACGTGASAVCVAGVLTGRTGREVLAHLPGGDLKLRWDEPSRHLFMTGPATEVFTGVLEP